MRCTFQITVDPGLDQFPTMITSLQTLFEGKLPRNIKVQDIDLKGMNILLVEDAPENQFLVKKFLEDSGAKIQLANNGEEAVAQALQREFDLVLMDIQMPVMDGFQATSLLRSKAYKKPIVALTAQALKAERERCLKSGFSGFLTKPIKRQELLRSVAKFRIQSKELTH